MMNYELKINQHMNIVLQSICSLEESNMKDFFRHQYERIFDNVLCLMI